MKMKKIYFTDVTPAQWDAWVLTLEDATYHHSWHWLHCLSKFLELKQHVTFALLDEESGEVLAICPFGISFLEKENIWKASLGYFPCGSPAVGFISAKQRRKLIDYIFQIYHEYMVTYEAKEIHMVVHPLTVGLCEKLPAIASNFSLELLRYQLIPHMDNTIVIDLSKSEEVLVSEMSKYHYRHIKRGRDKRIKVHAYTKGREEHLCEEKIQEMKQAHFISAGRSTRPDATWEAMCRGLQDGAATLFVASLEGAPISYLYCGEFSKMSFGWSQVNVKGYENFSARHLLEWEAILFYKKEKKYSYYEVGEKYGGPQVFHIPTEKELSIGVFKERYGGLFLPKGTWYGYMDKTHMDATLVQRYNAFIKQARTFSLPT